MPLVNTHFLGRRQLLPQRVQLPARDGVFLIETLDDAIADRALPTGHNLWQPWGRAPSGRRR